MHDTALRPQRYHLDLPSPLALPHSPSSHLKVWIVTDPGQQVTGSARVVHGTGLPHWVTLGLFHRRKLRKTMHHLRSLKHNLRSLYVVLGLGAGMTLIFNNLPSLQVRYYWLICSAYGQGMCVMDGETAREKGRRGDCVESKGKQAPLLHVQCQQPGISSVAYMNSGFKMGGHVLAS